MAWEVTALKALSFVVLWRKFAVSDHKMSESDTDSHTFPASDSSKFEFFSPLLSLAMVTSQLCSPSDLDLVVASDCDDEMSCSIESMTGWILAGHTGCLVSITGKTEETPILIIDCSGHFQQVVE